LVELGAHDLLLVKAVAQAFLGDPGGDAELLEQIVAADPVLQVGELGARLEQVLAVGVRVLKEQARWRHRDRGTGRRCAFLVAWYITKSKTTHQSHLPDTAIQRHA
jgi:hypothetical protein